MKESGIREIVREELLREDDFSAGRVREEIERFLSRNGEERRGTYTYKGYRFSTDQMSDMTAIVTMENAGTDPTGAETFGKAMIEDGLIKYGRSVTPQDSYTGPEELINEMIRKFG